MRAVLADRAERPARVAATAAEHEKRRIPGRVEQHSDGVALHDAIMDFYRRPDPATSAMTPLSNVCAMCLWS